MSVMKVIEIMTESKESWEDATRIAVAKARETVQNIKSAFVQSQSVTVENGEIEFFRVNVKITFEVK